MGCSRLRSGRGLSVLHKLKQNMTKTFKNLKNKYLIFQCRLMVALIAGLLGGLRAAAAGNGLSGINEATSMVTSYFDPGV